MHRCNFSLVSTQCLASTQSFTTTNELIIQTAISDPPWSRSSATWQRVCLLSGSYRSLPALPCWQPFYIPHTLFCTDLSCPGSSCPGVTSRVYTQVFVSQLTIRQQGLRVSDVTHSLDSHACPDPVGSNSAQDRGIGTIFNVLFNQSHSMIL